MHFKPFHGAQRPRVNFPSVNKEKAFLSNIRDWRSRLATAYAGRERGVGPPYEPGASRPGPPQGRPHDSYRPVVPGYDLPSSRSNGTAESGQSMPTQSKPAAGNGTPYLNDTELSNSYQSDQGAASYALQLAPQPSVVLSYHDALKGKVIISTAEGSRLGAADGAIIDSATMTLEAFTITEAASPQSSGLCVPIAMLTQVGDVILVPEERAMRRLPAIPDFVPIIGANVRSSRGTYIGRIKDIDFNPDTGEISSLYYDEYGINWLSLSLQLVNLYGIPVEAVLEVRTNYSFPVNRDEIVIDESLVWLASPGKLEGLSKALKTLPKLVGNPDDSAIVVAARQSRSLRQWEATYGMTAEEWVERYGDDMPNPNVRQRRDQRRTQLSSRREDAYMAGTFADKQPINGSQSHPNSRRPGARARRSQQISPYEPSAGGWGVGNSDVDERPQDAENRPSYGSVLKPDGRSPEFEQLRQPPGSQRKGYTMRRDDAF